MSTEAIEQLFMRALENQFYLTSNEEKSKEVFQEGDIVQIINEKHPWFPCLLIVDDMKPWGVQAYVISPKCDSVGLFYNRLQNELITKVEQSVIGATE